jgi:hypothetical protein
MTSTLGLVRFSRNSFFPLSAISVAAALALAACGGGSGGAPAVPATGTLQVRLTDGPAADYTSVWITVKEVWVHRLDTAQSGAAGWQKIVLAAPVTLDLNQLSNGAMSSVLGSLSLPVGTYRQIRLILAASDDPLTASAQAQTPPLQFNDQVNYVDKNGVAQVAPLEIAQATQGITLLGTFDVTAGGTLDLAVEFDVGDDVARFKHGGLDAFTMIPVLRYYDLSRSGAIVGSIDKSACVGAAPNPCKDFVIKAEELSADGSHHQVRRWTAARADGTFALFPLPAAAGQHYDVMLRGRNAQTMIVRNVPVTVGTSPASSPTVLSSTPLAAQPAAEFVVNWAAPANPTGVFAQFYQTVGAGAVPYEIRTHVMNPFTGEFSDDFPLTGGSVLLGDYVAGGAPVLTATVPGEGAGAYDAVVSGLGVARADAGVVADAGGGATAQIPMPTLQPGPNVASFGTISGTITQATAGRFDSGYLVVVRHGGIVNTEDIGAVLQAGGGAGGNYAIGNLPAGSASQPLGRNGNGAGIYYAYLRVWNSAHPLLTTRLVPIPGFADLDATNAATLNATLP